MAHSVAIEEFDYRTNTYGRGDSVWRVPDLIRAAKHCEVFELPLAGVDIGRMPWELGTIKSFVYHVKRMNEAKNFPVILDDEGFICDGWHRVSKALLAGKKTIKAVRLESMPEPVSTGAS